MAAKMARASGDYDKKVYDSGEPCKDYLMDSPGQSKAKMSKPASEVKYSAKQPSQKANKIMDSGEGEGAQKNEGGSKTDGM